METVRIILLILCTLNFIICAPIAHKVTPSTRIWINLHILYFGLFINDVLLLGPTNISPMNLLINVISSLIIRLVVIIWAIIKIRKSFISFRGLVMIIVENVILLITGYAVLYHSLVAYNIKAFSTSKLSIMSYLYYSVTTFTTTGYGDITPVSDLAKACVSSEMLLGFFVSTFVMAILVTRFLENRPTR